MAKHISHFAQGLQDHQSTNDWCEFLAPDTTCQPASHRDAIYGNACNRWCVPTAYGANNSKLKCDRKPKWIKYQMLGSGGSAWGSCCCMKGPPGGPGAYIEGCLQARDGDVYCYVVGMGGCCVPSSQQYGCFSLISNFWNECFGCVMGGYCGNSSCYYSYCCYDCTGHDKECRINKGTTYSRADIQAATDARPSGAQLAWRGHTIYKQSCSCGALRPWYSGLAACGGMLGYEYGLQPSMAGMTPDGKDPNDIPYGGHRFHRQHPNYNAPKPNDGRGTVSGWQYDYKRQRGDVSPSGPSSAQQAYPFVCGSGCCYGDGECQYRLCTMYVYSYGFNVTGCFYGCSSWQCGDDAFSAGGMGQFGHGRGHAVTGPRWSQFPRINASMTCGGFNDTGWYQCAWGMGDGGHCEYAMHQRGFGGMPANVCGGPCCCSGPPVTGYIAFKYRGGK